MSNTNIVENLEALLAAVEVQPENLFDLSSFRKDTPCGSNFCTVGLACTMPRFQALGFRLKGESCHWRDGLLYTAEVDGVAVYERVDAEYSNEDDEESDPDAADFAFGYRAWQRLFDTAGDGDFDKEMGYVYDWKDEVGSMTDKELAIARLKKQIETLKGEAE